MFNRKLNMIQSCSSWRRQLSWGCPSQIHAFYSYRDELAVQGKILFRANRVIVPAAIRSEMLKKIHASHLRWHWGQPSASKENPILVCNDGRYQGPCLCLRNMQFISHGTTQRAPHATESTRQALVKGCCGGYLHLIRQSIWWLWMTTPISLSSPVR